MSKTPPLMTLRGDENLPDVALKVAHVNHLRRLLAWLECEYTLNEHMQAGVVHGVTELVESGLTSPERASEVLQTTADRVNRVPAYVRDAVKSLKKAIADHEKAAGIVQASTTAKD